MDLKRKAIRVGIAASLCMLVSNLLKLKFPFFVLLPAVMPISTFFGETIKFGTNRIVGSFIGAIIGAILVNIQSQNIFLTGLGVILIVYICNYLKWDSTTSIACLVFASIMVGVKGSSAFVYSIHRLIDTFIGIFITTIVNSYVFNPDISLILKNKAKNIEANLLDIANNNNFLENKNELDTIEWELKDMREKLRIYAEEFKLGSKFGIKKDALENMVYTTDIIFEQIKMINYINKNLERITKFNIKDASTIINIHKNIFFDEITNLDEIMSNIK